MEAGRYAFFRCYERAERGFSSTSTHAVLFPLHDLSSAGAAGLGGWAAPSEGLAGAEVAALINLAMRAGVTAEHELRLMQLYHTELLAELARAGHPAAAPGSRAPRLPASPR